MSPIEKDWLLHGCMYLSDLEVESRPTMKIRDLISSMYGDEEFSVWSWPQRGYRDTVWWYEKSVGVPCSAASYFIKFDQQRGPALYAGILVEKAYEDEKKARQAAKKSQPIEYLLLDNQWDWKRAVYSLDKIEPLVIAAAKTIKSDLYIWVEFDDGREKSRYYILKNNHLYQRGGFKVVGWEELKKFALKPRPQQWGSIFIARAFTLDSCSPTIAEGKLMDVFEALRPVRDHWRGLAEI